MAEETNNEIPIDISQKVCIIGYSGSGKSSLLKYMIKNIKYPMVIVDTTNLMTKKVNIRYMGLLKPQPEFNLPNKRYVKLQTDEELEGIIKKINDNYKKPVFLVVDEIDQFVSIYKLYPETSLYFQQGRNYSHGGLFTVRQVGRLNKQILSNSKYLFMFKIFNKADIEYVSSIIGFPVNKLIENLHEHDFYILDLQNTKVLGRYQLFDNKLTKLDDE